MRFPPMVLWIVPLLVAASAACGADFTRAEVEFLLAAAPESPRPSFAGRSLAGLDLHALDFHEVDFTSADLIGGRSIGCGPARRQTRGNKTQSPRPALSS